MYFFTAGRMLPIAAGTNKIFPYGEEIAALGIYHLSSAPEDRKLRGVKGSVAMADTAEYLPDTRPDRAD